MAEVRPDAAAKRGDWRGRLGRLRRGVNHEAVEAAIAADGALSARFMMMSVLSAAIATLGLLLSSPAVVIGAMLISPLMGPIILLGFSFWMVNWLAARRAMLSLIIGLGLALLVAAVLTLVSPLKEPTAEILARTHPNLFDLMVAGFSGVAGGYAVIRQRGETVIGVAIATALMPPIATVGFGLGTTNWPIAVGALLLFATNLIAIALAAAVMAALYGFHPKPHLANRGWIGQGAVVLIAMALCVPLTLSLNTIALEGRATVAARSAVQRLFGSKARLASLTVRSQVKGLDVNGLVATPIYVDGASNRLADELKARLRSNVVVTLDQLVLADPSQLPAAAPTALEVDPSARAGQDLRDAVPFPTRSISYDPDAQRGVVLLGPGSGLDLKAAMALERGLRVRDGLAATLVIPPVQPLDPLPVTQAKGAVLAVDSAVAVEAWALRRWGSSSVSAVLCRRGARLKPADLQPVLDADLKQLSVNVVEGRTPECADAGTKEPYVRLIPSKNPSPP